GRREPDADSPAGAGVRLEEDRPERRPGGDEGRPAEGDDAHEERRRTVPGHGRQAEPERREPAGPDPRPDLHRRRRLPDTAEHDHEDAAGRLRVETVGEPDARPAGVEQPEGAVELVEALLD